MNPLWVNSHYYAHQTCNISVPYAGYEVILARKTLFDRVDVLTKSEFRAMVQDVIPHYKFRAKKGGILCITRNSLWSSGGSIRVGCISVL
jgi:hypothetical protein